MVKNKTTKVDLATVFGDKLFGFLMIVMIINGISYFLLKDTYIVDTTTELKKSIAKNDSLFFSNDIIFLDTNKIYPCDMGGKYLDNSIYTFVL